MEAVEPPTISEILVAARRVFPVAARTPLIESALLNRDVGRRVLVKPECLQRGGSFKFRGAWNHLRATPRSQTEAGVLAISSGNHAQGVARAAAMLGLKATIVMPADAPAPKVAGVRAYGSEIVSYDRENESREEVASGIRERDGMHFVRPYDDPLVIAGQGTVGLEIAEDLRKLGIRRADVLVPCSGGGLAAGCAIALESEAPETRVRTVEPEGFEDWRRSLAKGERLSNARRTGSLCDALLAEAPGKITWAAGMNRFGDGLSVTDEQALVGVAVAWRRLRIVLEPSGAVALAAAALRLASGTDPLVVVASGGNVEHGIFSKAIAAHVESPGGTPAFDGQFRT